MQTKLKRNFTETDGFFVLYRKIKEKFQVISTGCKSGIY